MVSVQSVQSAALLMASLLPLFSHDEILSPVYNNVAPARARPGSPHRPAIGRGPQHDGHDRRRAVPDPAAGHRRRGQQICRVGMDTGRGDCGGRWPSMRRAGRGISARRRIVCVSARDLWAGRRWTLDFLSLRLAIRVFRAAFDRLWLHWTGDVSGLSMAAARCATAGRYSVSARHGIWPQPVPALPL